MRTETEIVSELKDTLSLRDAAEALIAQADAEEAALDAEATASGYDVETLMERAVALRGWPVSRDLCKPSPATI